MARRTGQRVERISTGAGRTEDLFDPSGQLLGHLNGANGVWWEEYVHFDGRLLWYYTQATNVSRYFHVNALGSLGLATNQTGAPVEEMLYYPFGVRWQNTTGFGWDEKFAQFPQRDDDIQKYEASFREYDPGLGRWMSPDRLAGNIMNPQSLDRYTYVLNNPVSNIDPMGLSCIHTDDGTTADNGDGKGCSEMDDNPLQENVKGTAPSGAEYYAGLMQLAAHGSMYSMIGAVSGDGGGGGGATGRSTGAGPQQQDVPLPARAQVVLPQVYQSTRSLQSPAAPLVWYGSSVFVAGSVMYSPALYLGLATFAASNPAVVGCVSDFAYSFVSPPGAPSSWCGAAGQFASVVWNQR